MKVRKEFYLDIDGVLADLFKGLEKEGFPYPKDYFFNDYPEDKRKEVKALINDPSFLKGLPAIEEGILLAKSLEEMNLLRGIVTARKPDSKKETLEWLEKFGLHRVRVFFTEEKWRVLEETEGDTSFRLSLHNFHVVSHIFVDDNPFLANEIVKRARNSIVYMPEYPYNRDFRVLKRVVRVRFMREVLEREVLAHLF